MTNQVIHPHTKIRQDNKKDCYGLSHNFQRIYSHQWKKLKHTVQIAFSVYLCEECFQTFPHFYHETPCIFQAMRAVGVSEFCGVYLTKLKEEKDPCST